jgi:hypothetical protein
VAVTVSVGLLVGASVAVGVAARVEVTVGSWSTVEVLVGIIASCGAVGATLSEFPAGVSDAIGLGCILLQPLNSNIALINMNKPNILFEMCMGLLLDCLKSRWIRLIRLLYDEKENQGCLKRRSKAGDDSLRHGVAAGPVIPKDDQHIHLAVGVILQGDAVW